MVVLVKKGLLIAAVVSTLQQKNDRRFSSVMVCIHALITSGTVRMCCLSCKACGSSLASNSMVLGGSTRVPQHNLLENVKIHTMEYIGAVQSTSRFASNREISPTPTHFLAGNTSEYKIWRFSFRLQRLKNMLCFTWVTWKGWSDPILFFTSPGPLNWLFLFQNENLLVKRGDILNMVSAHVDPLHLCDFVTLQANQ